MKYVYLIVFVVIVIGGVCAGRVEVKAITARSASALYSKNCVSCHGKDGRAKTFKAKLNHARNLSDPEWQERVTDERIFNSITNGKGKMPAYGKKVSEEEINTLVTYVRSLKK